MRTERCHFWLGDFEAKDLYFVGEVIADMSRKIIMIFRCLNLLNIR